MRIPLSLIDDFLENFAPSMAVVSKTWPVCAFGTASNQETVRLSAVISREHRTDTAEGDFIELVQQSISGKEADDLQTLCLQVECPEHETAEKLAYLLGCVNWRTSIAVIPWSKMSVLSMQRLVDPNIRSFFCYIGADSCMAPDDFLRSLNFPQKVALWRAFFKGKTGAGGIRVAGGGNHRTHRQQSDGVGAGPARSDGTAAIPRDQS